MVRSIAVFLVGAFMVAACADTVDPPSDPSPLDVPAELATLSTTNISIEGRTLLVAVADAPPKRAQGLMAVDDLGDLDGLLFSFPESVDAGFWMQGVPMALDIMFFAEDGSYVDGFRMVPCPEGDCPTYRPRASYRYAVEAPDGDLTSFVRPYSVLRFES